MYMYGLCIYVDRSLNDHFCIWNCEAAAPYASKRDRTEGPSLGRTEKLWSVNDAETYRLLEQICEMWEDLQRIFRREMIYVIRGGFFNMRIQYNLHNYFI